MSAIEFSDINSLNDHLLNFRYLLKLGQVPGGADGFALTLRCQSCDWVGSTIDPVTVGLHGFETQVPGRHISQHTMAATFVEDRNLVVTSQLFAWQNYARDQRSGNAAASRFGGSGGSIGTTLPGSGGSGGYVIPLVELDVFNESGGVAGRNMCVNMWMQDRPNVQLDGSNSGLFLVQASLQLDIAYPVAGDSLFGAAGPTLGTVIAGLG